MNIGEEICGAYLKHEKGCDFIDYNIITTGTSVGQGEIDVIGIDQSHKIIYVCEVAVHIITGLQYTKNNRPNVYNKVLDKFNRDIPYAISKFPGYEIVPMFWSTIVKNTSSNPAQTDLNNIRTELNKRYPKIGKLQLIINEEWDSCVNKLRKKAGTATNELTGVMRIFQIEEHLKDYLSKNPKSTIKLP